VGEEGDAISEEASVDKRWGLADIARHRHVIGCHLSGNESSKGVSSMTRRETSAWLSEEGGGDREAQQVRAYTRHFFSST